MKNWFMYNKKENYEIVTKLCGDRLTKLQRLIIANRDIIDPSAIASFTKPTMEGLHDPFLMKDMDVAVALLSETIESGGAIRIVGDYDQDGNSATMTLIDGLMPYTELVTYAIPDRIEEGYGINTGIVQQAYEDGVDLIITCDNGISAFEALESAREKGIKVIVTDHHQLAIENGVEKLPVANAVLNPNRGDCSYPFKALCGAGVAFKLIQGLYATMDGDDEYLFDLIEYVAMGTVCDIVDLVDENRIFVVEGLKRINLTENYGIQRLVHENKWEKPVDAYALGFIIGPCINAGGRLSTAKLGVELFLEEDMDLVDRYAKELVLLNNERKQLTEEGFNKVKEQVDANHLDKESVIVVYDPSIHESIAGIIAGRIKDFYYRPTIVFTDANTDGMIKGSGRSIPTYDMFAKIDVHRELLGSFGGHPMAAGMSLEKANLKAFYDGLKGKAQLSKDDLIENIDIDLHLPIHMLSYDIIEEIQMLQPFGKGNPRPKFADVKLNLKKLDVVGANKNVLRMTFDNGKNVVSGVQFKGEKTLEYLEEKFGVSNLLLSFNGERNDNMVDVIYYPELNTFNGKTTLQLKIVDIR